MYFGSSTDRLDKPRPTLDWTKHKRTFVGKRSPMPNENPVGVNDYKSAMILIVTGCLEYDQIQLG